MRNIVIATASRRPASSAPRARSLVAGAIVALSGHAFAAPHPASAASASLPQASAPVADDDPFWKGDPLYDDPANWSRGLEVIYRDGSALQDLSDAQIVERFAALFATFQVSIVTVERVGKRDVRLMFDHCLHPAMATELARVVQSADPRIWGIDEMAPRRVGIDRVPKPGKP